MVTIYTASKPRHAATWRAMRAEGFRIIATWIDYADGGAVVDWQRLWLDCVSEAAQANVTLVYIEHGDELRGAYIEMGVAIANNRRVFFVNPDNVRISDATHHPLVTTFDSLAAAKAALTNLSKVSVASSSSDKRAA